MSAEDIRTRVTDGELFVAGQAVGASANSKIVAFKIAGKKVATFHIRGKLSAAVQYTEMLTVEQGCPNFLRLEYDQPNLKCIVKGSNTGEDDSWTTMVTGVAITWGTATLLWVEVSTR